MRARRALLRYSGAACLGVVTLGSCGHPPARAGSTAAADTPSEVRFTAVVRLPPIAPAKGKVFRGVLFEQPDGTSWVASYGRDELWATFADHHVEVAGTRYTPEGQALVLPHIHVTSLRIVDAERTLVPFTSMSGEMTWTGHFERWTWPPGTKLAGETLRRFVSVDGRALPVTSPDRGEPLDVQVSVHGRVVEPSLFENGAAIAGVGGPQLWVDPDE